MLARKESRTPVARGERGDRWRLRAQQRGVLGAVVLLFSLLPGSLAAQPFDLERARQAVVRVFGDRGNVVGSGSVVSVADGRAYILTAYHVIRADVQRGGVPTVQVEFFPDGTAEARISRERMDPTNDVAVLIVDKLPPSPPLVIHWGSSATLPETERVWALGHPRGGPGWVVSDGTVGRKTGAKLYFSGTAADAGNSGGPLLDGRGAVVGVITGEGGSSGVAVEADVVRVIIRAWVPALPSVAAQAPPAPSPSAPEAKAPAPTPTPARPSSGITGKDGAEMVLVPAGEFWMGSTREEVDRAVEDCKKSGLVEQDCKRWHERELPRHRVHVDGFYVDRYEVTNALFERFVKATGHKTTAEREGDGFVWQQKDGKWQLVKVDGASWRTPTGPGSSSQAPHPVVQVSWSDAEAYCRWAGKRLPTEAEWEKAARGTDGRRYPWGNEWDPAKANGNMTVKATSPVGAYTAGMSPFGVHDMAGNVWEWVADWFAQDYYQQSPERNPSGPTTGASRVLRGGSWDNFPINLRAASRGSNSPVGRCDDLRFRCARGSP